MLESGMDARWSIGHEKKSDPYGTRTRVAGVKGRSPRPLDEGARCSVSVTQFLLLSFCCSVSVTQFLKPVSETRF